MGRKDKIVNIFKIIEKFIQTDNLDNACENLIYSVCKFFSIDKVTIGVFDNRSCECKPVAVYTVKDGLINHNISYSFEQSIATSTNNIQDLEK